jgi:excisionase family DNA binding protein
LANRKYYTTFQASKVLGVSLATVVNWTKAGLLDAHRTPGGHRRIAEEDLVDFAKAYKMPLDPEIVEAHQSGQRRILVVDDDEEFLRTTRVMLETGEYVVQTAHSGFAAGLAVGKFKPTCIILDIRMPGMDGFEVAAMLRRTPPARAIPVIVCSAYLDEETQIRVGQQFDGFLEKPLDLDRLNAAVQAVLAPSQVQTAN